MYVHACTFVRVHTHNGVLICTDLQRALECLLGAAVVLGLKAKAMVLVALSHLRGLPPEMVRPDVKGVDVTVQFVEVCVRPRHSPVSLQSQCLPLLPKWCETGFPPITQSGAELIEKKPDQW